MGNSVEYREANRDKIAAYMRAYYLAHLTRKRMVPGATRESKTCKRCGVEKQRAEFTVRETGPRVGHLTGHCKLCSATAVRTKYAENHKRDPAFYRRVEWPSKLKNKYGITVADYERMLTEQGGGCALCGSTNPMTGNRAYKKRVRSVFDVDHCHKTGVVRGLLCTRCNRLVGLANDDPSTARKLVEYLVKER